jgi:hypothetical protein
MQRLGVLVAGLGMVGAALVAAGVGAAGAGEPPDVADVPGDVAGVLDCRWIAPYVATYGTGVGKSGGARTVWFDAAGTVVRDLVVPGGVPFVTVPAKDGGQSVHGTLADWTITLPPPPPGPEKWDIAYSGSGDGRTFVRQQTSSDGTTSADVWVDGKWTGRAGPALRWRGRSVHVGEDGSVALEVGRAPGERGMRVLVFAPGAKAAFEAKPEADDSVEGVAPAGRGVVLRRPRAEGGDELLFASAAGIRPLDLGVNAHVAAWLPGTSKAIVTCGTDDAPRLRLADLETGAVAWDVEDQPLGGRRAWPGVAIEGDLVLLSGLEASAVGKVTHWRRRVDALELGSGKPVATWRSAFAGAVGYAEAATLQRRGATLFLVTREQFAPVPVADVRARTRGWQ